MSTVSDELMPSLSVRRMLGGMSDMTLWRYLNDPKYRDLGFPKPDVVIRGRRYWYRNTIENWLELQQEARHV